MDAIPSSLCLMPSISIRGEIAIGSKKKPTITTNKINRNDVNPTILISSLKSFFA